MKLLPLSQTQLSSSAHCCGPHSAAMQVGAGRSSSKPTDYVVLVLVDLVDIQQSFAARNNPESSRGSSLK